MDSFITVLFFFIITIYHSVDHAMCKQNSSSCQKEFLCGTLGMMKFPFFSNTTLSDHCGLLKLECDADPFPILRTKERYYFAYGRLGEYVRLYDPELERVVLDRSCNTFNANISFPSSGLVSFVVPHNFTAFKCSNHVKNNRFSDFNRTICDDFSLYYRPPVELEAPPHCPHANCSRVLFPFEKEYRTDELFDVLAVTFVLEWHLSKACSDCQNRGGQCLDMGDNRFLCDERGYRNWRTIVMAALGGIAFVLSLLLIFFIQQRKKEQRSVPSYFPSGNASTQLSSFHELEIGIQCFGVPVFSYKEIKDATKNFDSSREIGEGGFGTVYHGKLSDGREVAVKRLHQHNVNRTAHFTNEIKILTGLKHENLVTLHGCTSRCSRELLLVYEYISNGTVAEHLHGERAKEGLLTWHLRMNIAVETATALAYLHACDIIHRDVKSSNILLNNNFCVKVADFGLSRLFPDDVTHVSTAPQGTPGYLDPEYHECYKLTDKSDVYSFGVVLVELITSLPAVDINRDKHEINLANMAMSRILRQEYDELIDPSLGFSTHENVRRMTISVAELAFRCLQLEKDLRPKMDEVLKILKEIQLDEFIDEEEEESDDGSDFSTRVKAPPSPDSMNMIFLRNMKYPNSSSSVGA